MPSQNARPIMGSVMQLALRLTPTGWNLRQGQGASGRKVWDHPRRAEFTHSILRFRYLEMSAGSA
jgi:hypothetical protein